MSSQITDVLWALVMWLFIILLTCHGYLSYHMWLFTKEK